MAQQAEARHVGHRARTRGDRRRRGARVQRHHHLDRPRQKRVPGAAPLARRRDRPHAERLREHQRVAGAAARVRDHPRRIDDTRHREAVLRLRVVDRVPAHHRRAGRLDDLQPSPEHLLEHAVTQPLERKRDDVHRCQGRPAHRIDVRERVGGRDPPEVVRVVHDRCEEVDRLDEREVFAHLEHRGVIPAGRADEHARILGRREVAHDRQQQRRGQLAAAPGAVGQRRKRDRGARGLHPRESTRPPAPAWRPGRAARASHRPARAARAAGPARPPASAARRARPAPARRASRAPSRGPAPGAGPA